MSLFLNVILTHTNVKILKQHQTRTRMKEVKICSKVANHCSCSEHLGFQNFKDSNDVNVMTMFC